MVKIVELAIEVLIFGAVIGTIALNVTSGANLTGASLTLYSLVTLVIVAGFIVAISKSMGLSKGKK